MAKLLKKSSATSLLDLPESTIVHIAGLLPCTDIPSLICTCRELAGMAPSFYGERHVLDMSCFDKVSPALCAQVVRRFASSPLSKCYFRCDFSLHSAFSPGMLQAIVERFLDNYHCNDDLLHDLHTSFSIENADWFPSVPAPPRPIDVLAHCFLLESLLSSQPTMSELILDAEFGMFRLPKSKGYRQHWYLMQPFLALQSVQRKCPSLERYACSKMLYQNSAVDMKHVQLRFLQNSKQLKSMSHKFELDHNTLESYENIQGPLRLEQAAFAVPKWCARQGESAQWDEKLRGFAQKMPHLKSVAVTFNSRGTLKYVAGLLRNLPNMGSLLLKCEFNAGSPSFDIDEGPQMGAFFEGFRSLLPGKVKKLSMVNVPEGEFDMIFSSNCAQLRESVAHMHVRFAAWSSTKLRQEELRRVEGFFRKSPHLQSLSIEGYNIQQEGPIFCKTLSRRSSTTFMQ